MGTGTPQSMSRVMGLSTRPASREASEELRTLGRHSSCPLIHSASWSSKALSLRNMCLVALISGALPQSRHRHSSRSWGSRSLPQASHWSPLAFEEPQFGQMPPTYLSARNLPSDSQ